MAISTEARNDLVRIVVGMFNGAPGSEILSQLTNAFEAGQSRVQIATNLAKSAEYQSLFPDNNTNAEVATKIVNNIVGDLATAAVKADAVALLTAQLNAKPTVTSEQKAAARAEVTVWALDQLSQISEDDAGLGAVVKALANKTEVAVYYSVDAQQNPSSVADAQDVLVNIDDTDESVEDAIEAIGNDSNKGETFHLTQGLDTIKGTSGDDTINAFAFNSVSGADTTTLQSVDTIDGGSGIDTLNIEVKASGGTPDDYNNAFVGTISNVEIININNSAAATAAAVTGTAFGEAAQQIWQIGAAGAVTALGANTAAGFRQVDANVSVASAASAAAQAVALDRFGEGRTITSTGAALNSVTVTGTVSDTNSDGTVAATTVAATAGLNVASFTLNSDVRTTLNLSQTGGSTTNISTVDASGSTGRITYDATAATAIANVKGGSANDTLTIATATDSTVSAVLDGGAGDDTLTANATGTGAVTVNGGAGEDTITIGGSATGKLTVNGGDGDDIVTLSNGIASVKTTDVINGGAGSDTISVAGKAFAAEDYILLTEVITNFETLRVTGATTAATIDASQLAGYSKFEAYGASSTFTKVDDGQSITAVAGVTATAAGYSASTTPITYAGTLNVTAAGTGTYTVNAETVNLTVFNVADNDGTADNVAATLAGNQKAVNVTLVATLDNAGTASAADDQYDTTSFIFDNTGSAGSLATLKISGNGAATVTNDDTEALVTVDASALASKNLAGNIAAGLTYVSTNSKAETIILGAGDDSVTLGASTQGAMDTVTGLTLVDDAATAGIQVDPAKSDAIQVNDANGVNVAGFTKVTTTASSLSLALVDLATSTTADAVVFAFGGDTYIYVDTSVAGDSTAANHIVDAADLLVKITGTVDLDLLVSALNL